MRFRAAPRRPTQQSGHSLLLGTALGVGVGSFILAVYHPSSFEGRGGFFIGLALTAFVGGPMVGLIHGATHPQLQPIYP